LGIFSLRIYFGRVYSILFIVLLLLLLPQTYRNNYIVVGEQFQRNRRRGTDPPISTEQFQRNRRRGTDPPPKKKNIVYNYMNNCNIIILTFVITALWDVVLRKMSENYEVLPSYIQFDFVRYLQPYFEKHTVLSAALIAGFVGATTQSIILYFHKLPTNKGTYLTFMTTTFIISALYGFVIKFSNLFPYLVETYYKNLGTYRSMYLDGVSGLIAQSTVLLLLLLPQAK